MPTTTNTSTATTADEARAVLTARAMRHPLRFRILRALAEGERSPKALSGLLEEKLGNTAYHVRMLAELGLVERTRQEPRRGAVENFYALTELGRQITPPPNRTYGVCVGGAMAEGDEYTEPLDAIVRAEEIARSVYGPEGTGEPVQILLWPTPA